MFLNLLKKVLLKIIFVFKKLQKKIEVINVITNYIIIYNSITLGAKSLGIDQASISLYLKDKQTKLFKGKYIFKLI